MQPFSSHTGIAVPLLQDDINTDMITPVHRSMKPDYAKLLFARTRLLPDGSPDPNFPFNKPQFQRPGILVTGRNFGCGSSREGAVWAMLAVGIKVIVARSFADIYRENCLQNGLLPLELKPADADAFEARVIAADGATPFTVDLATQKNQRPGRRRHCVRGRTRRPHAPLGRSRRYRPHAQTRRRDQGLGGAHRCRAAVAAGSG